MNKCFITRNNDQWETPKNIYEKYINNGYIDFNPLQKEYENSLIKKYNCNLYCNPPYSNIEPFIDYMIEHYKKGYKVALLLPSRTGTKWFRKLLNENVKIYFFTQRLKFSNKGTAPFDCFIAELDLKIKKEIKFIDRNLQNIEQMNIYNFI